MSCAKTWHLWRCDGCGRAVQQDHGEWAEADLPPRWWQVFGFDIHACSAGCRDAVQAKQIEESGKRYLWQTAKEKRWPGMTASHGVNTR